MPYDSDTTSADRSRRTTLATWRDARNRSVREHDHHATGVEVVYELPCRCPRRSARRACRRWCMRWLSLAGRMAAEHVRHCPACVVAPSSGWRACRGTVRLVSLGGSPGTTTAPRRSCVRRGKGCTPPARDDVRRVPRRPAPLEEGGITRSGVLGVSHDSKLSRDDDGRSCACWRWVSPGGCAPRGTVRRVPQGTGPPARAIDADCRCA